MATLGGVLLTSVLPSSDLRHPNWRDARQAFERFSPFIRSTPLYAYPPS